MTLPIPEKLRVLVVDDDEMNRRMMRLILSRENHHVELAGDGFEACEVARTNRFDIILMDLQMPEMDGVETSRRIRALETGSKNSYIVALTASFLPEKGSELFEAGIDNYIAKPFDVEHLRQMLKHGLGHRPDNSVYALEQSNAGTDKPELVFDPVIGLKRVGGDEDLFRELLVDFVNKLPLRIGNMKGCLAERDMDGLSRIAHNLKGVSSNLGVLQLSQYAGELENRAGQGYTESVILDLEGIEAVSEKFIQIVSNFLGAGNK